MRYLEKALKSSLMKHEEKPMPRTPIIYLDAASTTPCSDEV